jgi:osmotically inducible protein OsmC
LTLAVHIAGALEQADADNLIERAKGICPYVDATKNNVTLNLRAVLDTPVPA